MHDEILHHTEQINFDDVVVDKNNHNFDSHFDKTHCLLIFIQVGVGSSGSLLRKSNDSFIDLEKIVLHIQYILFLDNWIQCGEIPSD